MRLKQRQPKVHSVQILHCMLDKRGVLVKAFWNLSEHCAMVRATKGLSQTSS